MTTGLQALTEKEKQTLRLMLRGYDAKSMARHLNLSVHTINERLRYARRKLDVPSSREAARLLGETELHVPELATRQLSADKQLGDVPQTPIDEDGHSLAIGHGSPFSGRYAIAVIGGAIAMSVLFAALFLLDQGMPQWSVKPADPGIMAGQTPSAKIEEAEKLARLWLDLADKEYAQSGERISGAANRADPNLIGWYKMVDGRAEYGRALDREAQRIDIVHTNGKDLWIVRFRTDFERLRGAYEKVTLAYRDGAFITRDYAVE